MPNYRKVFQMKRIISYITLVAIMISSCLPVYAEGSISADTQTALIETEIERRLEIVMEDVYVQLEEQDALVLLDIYQDIMRADIEHAVMLEYGGVIPYAITYNMPNGGWTYYFTEVVSGEKNTEVFTTYYTPEQTEEIVYTELDTYTALFKILGLNATLLGLSTPIKLLLKLPVYTSKAVRENIESADDYSKIIHTYSYEHDTEATVVTGWHDHTVVTRAANAIDFSYGRFS